MKQSDLIELDAMDLETYNRLLAGVQFLAEHNVGDFAEEHATDMLAFMFDVSAECVMEFVSKARGANAHRR